MSASPRVALFCETFEEINGVALTARQLVAFAQRHNRPFLAIHGGPRIAKCSAGSVTRLELPRGPLSFAIESDLRYDLWLWRHAAEARRALEAFRPDAIHVTSPGEFGQLGAYLAHVMKIPLVASWHTNLHQFAAQRLKKMLSFLPSTWSEFSCTHAERLALLATLRFYKLACVTLAPTPQQVAWLAASTARPSFLMARGVDTDAFHPRHRTVQDTTLRFGYVGRVTPEKRVRFLVDVERALFAAGHSDFSFLVVGEGSERPWLRDHLANGVFPGILRGAELAEAYANLDVFLFPSRTDTYGNVIQEAAASGVPAIVTSDGGPKNLVRPGLTGFVAENDAQFIASVLGLARNQKERREMGRAARENMQGVSWDAVFHKTYAAYQYCRQIAASPPERQKSPFALLAPVTRNKTRVN
jgi:phosphatidylinositol alpha 1,6-mannosyltransferase